MHLEYASARAETRAYQPTPLDGPPRWPPSMGPLDGPPPKRTCRPTVSSAAGGAESTIASEVEMSLEEGSHREGEREGVQWSVTP